jgi:hypothetical protein
MFTIVVTVMLVFYIDKVFANRCKSKKSSKDVYNVLIVPLFYNCTNGRLDCAQGGDDCLWSPLLSKYC